MTYHGRLLKPNGEPVTSSSVQFRIQIRTPSDSDCLMFEEIQTKDLSGSNGMFSINIGDGTATTANTEPFTLVDAFRNQQSITFPAGKCAYFSSVTLGATDSRQLSVSFNDGSFSGWEPLPTQQISFVPMAMESVTLGGHLPSNLFRVHDAGNIPQVMAPWSPTSYQKLIDLVTNTTVSGGVASIGGNAAGFTGSLAGDVTGAQAATKVEKIQGNAVLAGIPSDKQVLTWNHTQLRWEPANVPVAGNPDWNDIVNKPAGTANGQVLQYDTSLGWKADKLLYTDLVKAGGGSPWPSTPCVAGEAIIWQSATDGFECAPISITETDPTVKAYAKNDPSSDFSTTGNVLTLNTVPITRGGTGAVSQSGAINNLLPSQGGNSGKLLQTNGTNVSWVDAPASGVTSINGATGASQTFNTAQANTAPTFTRVGDTHTLEIPLASTSGVTSGTISHTDYQTFSGKQNALGFTPLNPANNLSELASATTARTNLGLGTAATKNFGTSNGNLVELDGSGKIPSSLLPSQSGTYFAQGGNAFSAPAVLGTTDAQPLHLRTGGTDKMTILSNGKVGIGTINPEGMIEAATEGSEDPGIFTRYMSIGNTMGAGIISRRAGGTQAAPSGVLANQVLGGLYSKGYATTGWSPNTGAIRMIAAEDFTDMAQGTALDLSTTSLGETVRKTRMHIAPDGKIGIGTSTPTSLLQIGTGIYFGEGGLIGAAADGPDIRFGTGGFIVADAGLTLGIDAANSATNRVFSIVKDTSVLPGGVELFRVQENGRVGVGTSNPASALNIVGDGGASDDLVVDSFSDTQEGALMLRRARGTPDVPATLTTGDRIGLLTFRGHTGSAYSEIANISAYAEDDLSASSSGSLRISTRAAGVYAERMRVAPSGNVGIGTTNPSAKLHVAGEVQFGNTSSVCNSTHEGQQRYNATSKIMEFCNGTTWVSLSGVPQGAMCGRRSIYCNSGAPSYDWNSSNVTCQGATLTAVCNGSNVVTAVAGCPAGYVGVWTYTGGSIYFIISCAKS